VERLIGRAYTNYPCRKRAKTWGEVNPKWASAPRSQKSPQGQEKCPQPGWHSRIRLWSQAQARGRTAGVRRGPGIELRSRTPCFVILIVRPGVPSLLDGGTRRHRAPPRGLASST